MPKKKKNRWDRHNSGFRFDVTNELQSGIVEMPGHFEVRDEMQLYVTDVIGDPFDTDFFVRSMRDNPEMPIRVEVNSEGGSVPHAMGMFNSMVEHAGEVTVQITGQAASAGMIVAAAGDRIIANENASVFVHPANISVLWASASELKLALEMVDKATDQIVDLMATRSGQDRDVIAELVHDKNGMGTQLTAREAYDLGLVDEVRDTPSKQTVPESVLAMAKRKAALARAKVAMNA